MNRELEKFIKVYLDYQEGYDTSGALRATLYAFKAEYVERVRKGLEVVLNERELSTGDYERLTDIEFRSDEDLYSYLREMFQYLFEDGEEQPMPPV
ncbi:hypothetical protein OG785_01435 [Streptomyces sp. NBC_00006]|uniref:hypothetical protein n=1 Tax=unclassified Streptomyces TaxID=2593676 RepID=UPI00225861EA|nr:MULTISPECIES: hypothetical protein [unclassified Streptomyces]MCX4834896.1 hypothetical protein [Streptomyces sp. NBC_01016]MCX5529236.1 hypothetical protein [Streptomyces sp. NBC_00006]